jgi:VIT1/CCC1 family predicted Fe2+/Mn2+ transporter
VTALAVVAALVLTGWLSASLGGARMRPAIVRNVAGGVLAMVVTYGIGSLVGLSI